MGTLGRWTAAALCALLLAACASFPENPPLLAYDRSVGYRFANLEAGDNGDRLFVIVTFSGGGTRAAALAYGALEALRDTPIARVAPNKTLLDEVDVISSISGGSFPAAYYGLRGRGIFDDFPDKFLYRPVQSDLVKQLFSPINLLKLGGSSYGRSDLAAEFYDREVFAGATYADLVARKRRPFVVLNATDMTIGAQFSFIQDHFDLICSDLSAIPVARAAAASSAFPGGLTALTFKNHGGTCGYRQPDWVGLAMKDHAGRRNPRRTARAEDRLSYTAEGAARRDYIHLTDGGVADNIGLRGPLAAVTSINSPWSVLQLINQQKVGRLVVIVVNAATDPVTKRDKTPKVPGLVDTLTTAATVPLDNYSFDTLELLKATVDKFNDEVRLVRACKTLAAKRGPACVLTIPEPYRVEFYPIQVAFDYLPDPKERAWFKNLPTTFELPHATIDKIRAVARRLLNDDPEFKRLMVELQ
jgi:hypothetical protein